MQLSNGFEKMCGIKGNKLSGGQKQRVAIARAFLKQPKILLLDEATSALDKVSEAAVQNAIDQYRKTNGGITTIVIAHRLSTIKDSDKILVIKKGKLVEEGSHDQLLEQYPKGTYAGFVEKQKSSEAQNQDQETTKPEEEKKSVVVTAEDPEDERIMSQIREEDKVRVADLEKAIEETNKQSLFKKLLKHNKPAIFIWLGCLTGVIAGASMPINGWIMSEYLVYATAPFEIVAQMALGAIAEGDYVQEE